MKKQFSTKQGIFEVLIAVFIAATMLANVLAGRIWTVWGDWTLTGGVFIFPISLVVGDILGEVYGFKAIRKVAIIGFIISGVSVLIYTLINLLPNPVWFDDGAQAFKLVLGNTPRAFIGGLTAFLLGQLVNGKVLVHMKGRGDNPFWLRALISTILGEFVDSIIFVVIMFAFRMPIQEMLMMVLLQTVFKTLVESILLPLTSKVVVHIEKLDEVPVLE